ncbi:hypothetical protein AUG86_01325 [Euryarchaeota archaeon 13_1_20CM_4_64_14]|nr:MAG: hypothetical protein AUG86_01325 [Euryarchaeota archaeon 13_1_20CM_4_64_14]
MPGPRGRNRVATPTDLVGLGLIGFATNCLMVVFNTSGIEKKDTDKLGGGWGLAHLSLGSMMVILGVSDYLTGPLGALSGYTGIALVFYGFFWIFLGGSLVRGYDLRPVGQVSIAYAIVDLWLLYESWKINQATGTFYSLTILLVVLTVVFIVLYAAVHGRPGLLKVNAVLLVILALLGFYIGFSLVTPGYTAF